jgi:hypothetical protein
MVEAYHRRLALVRTQASQLMRSVKTTQEVTAIRIDVSRNRIIRTNLHLTIASVSIGIMTALAGFLGMNLELPLWLDGGFTSGGAPGPGPFLTAVAVSGGLGGAVYGFGLAHASGALRRTFSASRSGNGRSDVEDVVALGRVFEDMSSIENAVHAHMGTAPSAVFAAAKGDASAAAKATQGRGLTKAEFQAVLAADTKRAVSARELELIYEVFDVNGDGLLRNDEVAAVQAEHAFRRNIAK